MLQLRELHLELAFEGARTLREDVQDQCSPIENPALDMAFEIAFLGGAQRVIHKNHVGAARLDRRPDLVGLA